MTNTQGEPEIVLVLRGAFPWACLGPITDAIVMDGFFYNGFPSGRLPEPRVVARPSQVADGASWKTCATTAPHRFHRIVHQLLNPIPYKWFRSALWRSRKKVTQDLT